MRAYVCMTPSINMASILSLPDDCLYKIVCCMDDPSSFYNITLTCKRFLQVTKNAKRALHTNLLRAKAEYFIKCYIVEISGETLVFPSDYGHERKYDKLRDLLHDSVRLTAARGVLSYDRVIDVWQRNGAVAATLFMWVRKLESWVDKGKFPTESSFAEQQNVTLHLPNCGKNMVIEASHFGDYTHSYDPELTIHITCGDLDVTSEGFPRSLPEDYMSWKKKEVSDAIKPMKAVIKILQKELGMTVPPITDHFFIWLCFFFPDKSNLLGKNRLSFKDASRNTKPNHASVQTVVDQFHEEQQFESKLQKLVSGWQTEQRESKDSKMTAESWEPDEELKFTKMIAEILQILGQRSETKILECLQENASRFYEIATYYDLKKLRKQFLLDLVLRTSLEASTYKPASIANKYVESRVSFKCLGGKVMEVCGSIRGDDEGWANWEELELKFNLPDGKVLELKGPLEIDTLSPVTELLQESASQTMHLKQHIPEMDNFYTAVYFLHALEFADASDIAFNSFDSLYPLRRFPESEEDLVGWYSSPEEESYDWGSDSSRSWRDDVDFY